ncbi:MAG: hypothetical protein ACREYE_12745 [Gammaproteobacteria bacterium]
MSETIAITGKPVKLFKGHYTSNERGAAVLGKVACIEFSDITYPVRWSSSVRRR